LNCRYVDRLVNGLQQKRDLIAKSSAGVQAVEVKREEVHKAINDANVRMAEMIQRSRALKRNVELALSKVIFIFII
jgi:CDK5 regulatory subunit-associated protein 3